jgi:Cu2+-exporting ATPase
MSCRAPHAEPGAAGKAALLVREENPLASRSLRRELRRTDISVPAIHCGGCMQAIEKARVRIAAVSLSLSSLIVIGKSFRLHDRDAMRAKATALEISGPLFLEAAR